MRERVIEAAERLGLDIQVRRLDESTRTVPEAARAVGVDADEIAKSIVFVSDGDPIVCVLSGRHRVDLDKLAVALDCAEVRQAGPEEVRAATGFPVGGVPPFGHGLPVVLDESLLTRDLVWAAGGDGHSLFAVDPRRLADSVSATVAPIA